VGATVAVVGSSSLKIRDLGPHWRDGASVNPLTFPAAAVSPCHSCGHFGVLRAAASGVRWRSMDVADLKAKIRDIKNFPTEGILFKDITTLLKDGPAFRYVVDTFVRRYQQERIDVVVAVESRGFVVGGALAHQLNAGFVPVRKLGKLPGKTVEVEYELEYGRDALAIHEDAIKPGQRVLAVDDLLATGGTMAATLRLIDQLGGHVVGVAFMIELAFLHGRDKLKEHPLHSLIVYD